MKRLNKKALGAALAVILLLAACQQASTEVTQAPRITTQIVPVEAGGTYTDVSADSLYVLMSDKDFLLINVHIPYEGEIEGTDLFIPFDEVEENLDKLPPDKGEQLVLYCRSGGMSAIAARTLVGLGYSNVWNLDGGMIAWEEAGYPLLYRAR